MNDYEDLKHRVGNVIEECEKLMNCIENGLQSSDPGLLDQLKVIEKTIENMQTKRLSIPTELRKLKLDLISNCDEVEKINVLKRDFINNIYRIFSIKTVEKKNLNMHVSPKSSTTRRVNNFPPDGTLCRFTYKTEVYKGEIKDRQFVVEDYGFFSSFSSASVKISNTSRNGWRDWELWIPGTNQWILADIWRQTQKERKISK